MSECELRSAHVRQLKRASAEAAAASVGKQRACESGAPHPAGPIAAMADARASATRKCARVPSAALLLLLSIVTRPPFVHPRATPCPPQRAQRVCRGPNTALPCVPSQA